MLVDIIKYTARKKWKLYYLYLKWQLPEKEKKKLCQYIIVTDSTCQETDTSGNEEILNIIFDMKSSSHFNIHSKVQMYDNLNPKHTHIAYTTTNKCQIS